MKLAFKKTVILSALAAIISGTVSAQPPADGNHADGFDAAWRLYERGLYAEAAQRFDLLHSENGDVDAAACAVLCRTCMKVPGYEAQLADFAETHPYSGLLYRLHLRHGLNLFDEGDYQGAAAAFSEVDPMKLYGRERTGLLFKRAYCDFRLGQYDSALHWFSKVDLLSDNDFSAPARYASGYILYEQRKFAEAVGWFEKSVKDPRFEDISAYYLAECKFMLKDYGYVADHAESLYASIPEDRKPHLARIISESYLVFGQPEKAMRYYDTFRNRREEGREDLFYAGSLLYALKDYRGAIGKFSRLSSFADSLGQIAAYEMGYSYIKTKNKIAAAEAFRQAASGTFDPRIREDALFNYAKLCFDLNKDGTVFREYMDRYGKEEKNDLIYSYIALAALYDHDYAAAVEAYDHIDELDRDMRGNYIRANYLRADQLISNGAWRDAVFYLKAAAYYSDRYSPLNQLSRYWLAEAYFRDGRYEEAREVYTDLYHLSALDGRPEGRLLPYHIAYCHFHREEYDQAAKWFGDYLKGPASANAGDARTRLADCDFARRDYRRAAEGYEQAIAGSAGDLYPCYQAGIAYGLLREPERKLHVLSNAKKARSTDLFYPEAMLELARTYTDAKMDEAAIECYHLLVNADIDKESTAKALLGIGIVERNRSAFPAALSAYKRVVASLPGSACAESALLAIESIYQAEHRTEEYLAYLDSLGEAGRKTEADRERLFFNSAEQLFTAGNYGKALPALESFAEKYPESAESARVDFYRAECHRNLGAKEQACDLYRQVMTGDDRALAEAAAFHFARLSYSMERYAEAYRGYAVLDSVARMPENKKTAALGLMSSAYLGKDYENAVLRAERLTDSKDADIRRESRFIKARSLLAMSRRDEAFPLLRELARQPSTDEGAEAAYLVISDEYERGNFKEVEDKVFRFSEKAGGQKYWLAKAFLVLGDSYADQENFAQARATFESIRDGYAPPEGDDEIKDQVTLRLKKLVEMGK